MVFNNLDDVKVGSTSIAKVYRGSSLIWQAGTPPTPTEPDWLTMTILSGGTIMFGHHGGNPYGGTPPNDFYGAIEYKVNDGSWATLCSSSQTNYFTVQANDVVKLRGDAKTISQYTSYSTCYYSSPDEGWDGYMNNFSGSTASFNLSGNILSMEYSSGFTGQTVSHLGWEGYGYLFASTNVIDARGMTASGLTQYGGGGGAEGLFSGCTGLTFATAIGRNDFMFVGCSNLSYIKCLDEGTSLAANMWAQGVSPTGTFVKSANATWVSGVNGIPTGWTIIDE